MIFLLGMYTNNLIEFYVFLIITVLLNGGINMVKLRCPECKEEISDEMIDVNMCFLSGCIIEKSLFDNTPLFLFYCTSIVSL